MCFWPSVPFLFYDSRTIAPEENYPNSNTNPNLNWRAIFLEGNFPDTIVGIYLRVLSEWLPQWILSNCLKEFVTRTCTTST